MIDAEPNANVDLWRQPPFTIGWASVRPSAREVAIGDRLEFLEPRVMQVLVVLARRRGEVVSREELIAACWRWSKSCRRSPPHRAGTPIFSSPGAQAHPRPAAALTGARNRCD
jgi:hypothetical protein